ncbi:MAG: c-type cytochrome [Bacteroidia bacterium]|nr:c-type cytochrome [Bacteroidia bacterium]
MDTGLLHTHHLFVVLYLLLYLTKFGLLAARRGPALERLNRKTKVLHIVLASGFTLTGLVLAFRAPASTSLPHLVKYAALVAVIGLGVVAFKRRNVVLGALGLVLLAYSYGLGKTHDVLLRSERTQLAAASHALGETLTQDPVRVGERLYQTACARCHGTDGASEYRKSRNLQLYAADTTAVVAVLKAGLKPMPRYDYLSEAELRALALYVGTLKQP